MPTLPHFCQKDPASDGIIGWDAAVYGKVRSRGQRHNCATRGWEAVSRGTRGKRLARRSCKANWPESQNTAKMGEFEVCNFRPKAEKKSMVEIGRKGGRRPERDRRREAPKMGKRELNEHARSGILFTVE